MISLLKLLPFVVLLHSCYSQNTIRNVYVSEMFSIKLEPQMFNWTHHDMDEQYQYRPSLEGFPDLPSWMRYMYSHEYHAGYLYGSPTEKVIGKDVRIEIVALNKMNYETRKVILPLFVASKKMARNVVQMKIDNLNWVHMMDPGRVENLKNIFRMDLWPESQFDLRIVFMESAVKMGARVPLRPQQEEGVIVHLGSDNEFSTRLLELQEEVKPLYKISSCSYKRTSVQTIFEQVGFKVDWCAFRTVSSDEAVTVAHHSHAHKSSDQLDLRSWGKLEPFTREDAPERNYIDEITLAIAIPSLCLAILIAILSGILCFYNDKIHDPHSELFFDNIFHICTELREKRHNSPTVQMVHCTDTTNHTTTILKSLKEPSAYDDELSLRSHSPCTSNYQEEESPRANSYMRPRPPPYKPPGLGHSGNYI